MMEEHILLDREKERNYFQLERDKIHTFCEITDNELEEVRAEKKKIDKDIEEDERRHQVEIKDVSEQVTKKKLDQQKCHYETLEQKFCKLQLERDELEKMTTQNIQQLQDKAGRKSMLLERELAGLTGGLEETHAQLLYVLSASNMDKTALDEIEKYLDSSHYSIKNLEYERAKLSQAPKDLLYFYEAKQRALGIPVEEL